MGARIRGEDSGVQGRKKYPLFFLLQCGGLKAEVGAENEAEIETK